MTYILTLNCLLKTLLNFYCRSIYGTFAQVYSPKIIYYFPKFTTVYCVLNTNNNKLTKRIYRSNNWLRFYRILFYLSFMLQRKFKKKELIS